MKRSRKRKSDGSRIPRSTANKQIRGPKSGGMRYVGLDVHKESIQVAVVDGQGRVEYNRKIKHDHKAVARIVAKLPPDTKYVMESSSVWYGLFRFMADKLHRDVILSNPYNTKIIAASVKKTDKVDAFQLANLLRGGYISECYVPDAGIIDGRQLVRHRHKLVRIKSKLKNMTHAILLQNGTRTKGSGFSALHRDELRNMGDYRIDNALDLIEFLEKKIESLNWKVYSKVKEDKNAEILMSMPGIGRNLALLIASEIGDIGRFPNSHKLCANAGIVPTVRSSANTTYTGNITKRGSSMLRYALIEAMHSHVRFAPDSSITMFYNRIRAKRGKAKATVAAASKMLRVIYWMLKEQREFTPSSQDIKVKSLATGLI